MHVHRGTPVHFFAPLLGGLKDFCAQGGLSPCARMSTKCPLSIP